MRAALFCLIGISLAVPAAGACSLHGPVPEPGYFFLWEPESGDETWIPVKERGLSADCRLSNPFHMDERRFAWTAGANVTIRNLQTQATSQHVVGVPRVHDVRLVERHAYVIGSTPGGKATLYQYEIQERRTTPIAEIPSYGTAGRGHEFAWLSGPSSAEHLTIFNASRAEKSLDSAPLSRWNLAGSNSRLLDYDGRYAFIETTFHVRPEYALLDWRTGIVRNLSAQIDPLRWPDGALDVDGVWVNGYDPVRREQSLRWISLDGSVTKDFGTAPHSVATKLVVHRGVVALGEYIPPETHTHNPVQPTVKTSGPDGGSGGGTRDPPPVYELPAPSGVSFLLAGALLFAARRFSNGRGA